MEEVFKTVAMSKVQQIQIVMPQYGNTAGRLFGGQLMAWIDIVGGVVAFRHTGRPCTTASVDYLSFDRPIAVNEVIFLEGCITHVGNTSMEIRVDTFIERPGVERELANRAYLTYVCIDENGRPIRVPRLKLESAGERKEWEAGEERAKVRKERRARSQTATL